MKKLPLLLLNLTFVIALNAQIKNQGFETLKDSTQLPIHWNINPTTGYTINLSKEVKHSGNTSFQITGLNKPGSGVSNLSQIIPIETDAFKKIRVSSYIKTENIEGAVIFWYRIQDHNDKIIGYENLANQSTSNNGTDDWKKSSLNILVGKDAKKTSFGIYLSGKGKVWIDDFEYEELQATNTPPTNEVTGYSKELSKIVKNYSIYKDSLNWGEINDDIALLSKGMVTLDDAKILSAYILQKLRKAGDNHSFLQTKAVADKYISGENKPLQAEGKLLENNIGYISVPPFGSINAKLTDEFASNIQDQIRKIDTENEIGGWIVDLRTNTGGNMFPMIAGLGPIIGDGKLGYFVKPSGKSKTMSAWAYPKDGIGVHSSLGVNINQPYILKHPERKIAVLIGPKTSSSGEMTAISFIGKDNTKLFGEASGGYTSANRGFKLSDGSYLYLASSYIADRNKKEYTGKIQPDVSVKPIANEDATLKSAQNWLLEK